SLRQASMRLSTGRDGPPRMKCLSVLEDEPAFARGPALLAALLEIAFEAFKKVLSRAGLRDEDVAPVALIANPAQIAEPTERIQGTRDHRLRYAEQLGEAAHGVRSGREVDQQTERPLQVGESGLTRP